MSGERGSSRGPFISNRFAVAVIAILFGASLAGWIATELVPPDVPERADYFREIWGSVAVKLVAALRLYDPFHSVWYRFALALFFAVLLLCVVSRWRQLALRSWRPALPVSPGELHNKRLSFAYSWRLLESGDRGARDPIVHFAERHGRTEPVGTEALRGYFVRVAALFRRRGFRIASRESAEGIAFAAYAGRFRSPGTMLFHVGLLAITIGGIVGSYLGWREMVFVREGSTVPFPRNKDLTIHLDRFEIATTDRREIRSFVSTVSVVDERGIAVAAGDIEVNHPMKVRGCRIFQSEFRVDEGGFARARVAYFLRESGEHGDVDLAPDRSVVFGDSAITVRAVRYFPDFRTGPEGAFSASPLAENPALEVEVSSGGRAELGWIFLYHKEFSKRFAAPIDLSLVGCVPVYYSGLEVSANPGAGVLLAGFAVATLGLLLMYARNPRVVRGYAAPDGIVVAAGEHRWEASFEREFADLREEIRKEVGHRGKR